MHVSLREWNFDIMFAECIQNSKPHIISNHWCVGNIANEKAQFDIERAFSEFLEIDERRWGFQDLRMLVSDLIE